MESQTKRFPPYTFCTIHGIALEENQSKVEAIVTSPVLSLRIVWLPGTVSEKIWVNYGRDGLEPEYEWINLDFVKM